MTQERFRRGQKIILGKREHLIEQQLPNGVFQLRDVITNNCRPMSYQEMVDALFEGHLTMAVEGVTPYAREKAANMLTADFSQLSEDDRKRAKKKYAYVKALLDSGIDRKTKKALQPLIKVVSKDIGDQNPPSAISVYRWSRDFMASEENIRSLLPLDNNGNSKERLSKDVRTLIDSVIEERYMTQQKNSPQSVYDTVVARVKHENDLRDPEDKLEIPSRMAVYRAVKRLDPYEVMKARDGKRLADLKFKPKKQGDRPTRALERVEIDHTKLDLFVVDHERNMPIGRPWLTLAIDVATKCIVGFYISFNPPSYLSVMHCMRHAIKPKTYVKKIYPDIQNEWEAHGIMEKVVVDNGKEFHSTSFEDACLQLGIVIQYAPIRLAHYKPSVERSFRTINTRLLHQQPGTTFSNVLEKSEYDSQKNALIDMETLLELVHAWIIDENLQHFHRGIKAIPANVWKKAVEAFPPALPRNNNELNALLGMVDYRVISASGVEFKGLFYNSDELAMLRRRERLDEKTLDDKRVKIKVDPSDLGLIHVFDKQTSTFIPVEAANLPYANGLSLWQHKVITNYALKEFGKDDIVTLALAKERIQKIVEKYLAKWKKKGTHQKVARWLNTSQDRIGQILDEPAETTPRREGIQHGGKPSITLPMPSDHPANGVAETVSASSNTGQYDGSEGTEEAEGEIVHVASRAAAKTGRTKRRKQSKGTLQEAATAAAPQASTTPLYEVDDEELELDMAGYSSNYSLPQTKTATNKGGKHAEKQNK